MSWIVLVSFVTFSLRTSRLQVRLLQAVASWWRSSGSHTTTWGFQRLNHFDGASNRDFTVSLSQDSQDTQGCDLLGDLQFSLSADSRHSKAKSATEVSEDVKTHGNQQVQHEKQGCERCKDCDASGSVISTFGQALAYVQTWRVALLLTSGPFYLHGMEFHLKLGQPPSPLVTILNKDPREANVVRKQKTRRSSKKSGFHITLWIGQILRQTWRRLSFNFLGRLEVTGKTETRPDAVCELWLEFWVKLRLASRIWFGPIEPHFNMIGQASLKPCTSSLQSMVLFASQIHCFGLLQSGVVFLAFRPLRRGGFKSGQ